MKDIFKMYLFTLQVYTDRKNKLKPFDDDRH